MKKYPKAIWPYSPYYVAWDLLFCSWQIWLNPETMKITEWWIGEETIQVIKNIEWVLKENWLELKDIVKTTIFLEKISDFKIVNEIYWQYFLNKPARSTIWISQLPLWAKVEIEVIAFIKKK